uniref:Uncharacterized protein n=1 Tax=Ditylenchus dipsaci TaxID=166011 RepID=A0A915CYN1_9BILA
MSPPSGVDSREAWQNSMCWFRTMVLVTTCIAILAVDFQVFPRHFGKTKSYGHSLMDTGTAAFVFLNGLSDYGAYWRTQAGFQTKARSAHISIFCVKMPSIAVILVLGIGRLLYVQFCTSHTNLTEYGVYWNFYITIFCLRVYAASIKRPNNVTVGISLGIFYQCLLTFTRLEAWILREDYGRRFGLLDQNREGLFQMLGYFFLYSLTLCYSRIMSLTLLRKNGHLISG